MFGILFFFDLFGLHQPRFSLLFNDGAGIACFSMLRGNRGSTRGGTIQLGIFVNNFKLSWNVNLVSRAIGAKRGWSRPNSIKFVYIYLTTFTPYDARCSFFLGETRFRSLRSAWISPRLRDRVLKHRMSVVFVQFFYLWPGEVLTRVSSVVSWGFWRRIEPVCGALQRGFAVLIIRQSLRLVSRGCLSRCVLSKELANWRSSYYHIFFLGVWWIYRWVSVEQGKVYLVHFICQEILNK